MVCNHTMKSAEIGCRYGLPEPDVHAPIPETYGYILVVPTLNVIRMLELVGFAAIGGTIYAFLGMGESEYRWPVFWGCAGLALAVIIIRRKARGQVKV